MNEAEERITTSKKLVAQAEETLKLAEGRYNSEVGSAIEVTDARVTLLNAQISYIQALYDGKNCFGKIEEGKWELSKVANYSDAWIRSQKLKSQFVAVN